LSRAVEAPAAQPSPLLVRGVARGATLVDITPERAGWRYVGFSAHRIAARGALEGHTGERESPPIEPYPWLSTSTTVMRIASCSAVTSSDESMR